MALENYPDWTCTECAKEHGGEWRLGHVGQFYMHICDVCNEWKPVVQPEDYCFPKFTLKRNRYKIFTALMDAMNAYMKANDYDEVIRIIHLIDEIIHELVERRGKCDGTAFVSCRDKRRKVRERSSETSGTMRESTQGSICETSSSY